MDLRLYFQAGKKTTYKDLAQHAFHMDIVPTVITENRLLAALHVGEEGGQQVDEEENGDCNEYQFLGIMPYCVELTRYRAIVMPLILLSVGFEVKIVIRCMVFRSFVQLVQLSRRSIADQNVGAAWNLFIWNQET